MRRQTSEPERPAGARAATARGGLPLSARLAVAWLALMLIVAVLADVLAPYGILTVDLRARLVAPGHPAHWLGTDELGRDVLSRLFASIRVSLLLAFGASVLSACIGTGLGFLAAQRRGLVEQAILALVDVQAAVPFPILALTVLAFVGNGLLPFLGLMGLCGWERHARVARGLARAAEAQGYAGAVRQLGAHPLRIYLRHILPNSAATLIVLMVLVFPEAIMLESGLSFLGLGVQPPLTSLGTMIAQGRDYLTRSPWLLLAPALTIVLTTLAVSTMGDWLRNRLDPTSA
jgi:peptide/nickel transport system permease protein